MQKTKSRVFYILISVLLIVVGLSVFRIATAESARKINVSRNDPINGNEREFLRMFKLEDGDMTMHVSNLRSDKFILSDEGNYSFVALCHNASGEELRDVYLRLSYPDYVSYSGPNVATATIEWSTANGETGSVVSDIALESVENMTMNARDVYIVINDAAGNVVPFDREVSIVNGIVAQDIYLGTLPAGEIGNYTIFVVSHARSVI